MIGQTARNMLECRNAVVSLLKLINNFIKKRKKKKKCLMSVWKANEKLVIFASLNFIRLLRVVFSSQQRLEVIG